MRQIRVSSKIMFYWQAWLSSVLSAGVAVKLEDLMSIVVVIEALLTFLDIISIHVSNGAF